MPSGAIACINATTPAENTGRKLQRCDLPQAIFGHVGVILAVNPTIEISFRLRMADDIDGCFLHQITVTYFPMSFFILTAASSARSA